MSAEDQDWSRELERLEALRTQARAMGGPERVRRQHERGRLTVRERIGALLDAGSFREIGSIAGGPGEDGSFTPANIVFGRGRIDGRPAIVVGDDFTVRGGASDAAVVGKMELPEQLAGEYRVPLVRLVEGGGGSVRSIEALGRTYVPANPGWAHVVENLATVPVVALALGPCAGIAAARVVASHYSVMVSGNAQVFAAGPPLVARAGEQVDKEELGGAEVQTRNGVVADSVADEAEAFERARQFLSYLPASAFELPPRGASDDDPERRDEWLLGAIPRDRRRAYRIRPIIESVTDRGSFFEIGRRWGRSIVTGLARLDGWPVAVLASDPYFGGAITTAGARKMEGLIDLAETFHLPVVHLVDQPGIAIGTQAEQDGTLRAAVRALSAVYQARVPWCSIVLRRVFGVGGAAHCNASRAPYRYAWPSGDWGSLPVEGGIEAAFRSQLAASEDPDELRAQIAAQLESVRSPFLTAEAFAIEEIVDPRETRPLLCEFAELAAPLRAAGPAAWGFRA